MLYLYCDRPSRSARILRDQIRAFGRKCLRIRHINRRDRRRGPVINWGSTRVLAEAVAGTLLNKPLAVKDAVYKTISLPMLEKAGIPVVRITTNYHEALKWFGDEKRKVFARKDGLSGGRGIRTLNDGANYESSPPGPPDMADTNFWSLYFNKTHEFRVHVFQGQVIDFVQKRGKPGADREIRTYNNGWIYSHRLTPLTDEDYKTIEKIAVAAVQALKLDFGAVDVLVRLAKGTPPRKLLQAVVCEVNTAPGLDSPATINAYAKIMTGV